MRTTNPFLISVGIHLTLFALSIGALSVLHKTMPIPVEKIKLKILIPTSEPEVSAPPTPIQPQQAVMKAVVPEAPVPETQKPRVITPPKPSVIPKNAPVTPMFQPPVPVAAPTSVVKTAEVIPAAVPKAPPPPKVQENYEEENLGRIRSILADRLKYPKNALRLKQQGESTVTFTLGTDRTVSQITISQSSGFELLDEAARSLIESSASEFPKPSKSVRISVPIAYKLR